ncbi:MAG: hypothetical protein AAF639_08020 [Chloroflexota bacterium]
MPDYKVIETEWGPMVSHSKVMIYDIIQTLDSGKDIFFICVNYHLEFIQAQIALEYIEEHREQLEEDLKEILPKKAARENHYRAIEAEIRKKTATKPLTPQRAKFYALLAKNGITREQFDRGDYATANYR